MPVEWAPGEQLGVGHLALSETAKALVIEVLNSNRLSYGLVSKNFESSFASVHDRRFGIVSNSGTSALHVALESLKEKYGWRDGDEVIVPALTFVATANIVLHSRMKPVFVDVDPRTYNIDVERIDAAVGPKTRCVIPVHLCGLPADMPAVLNVASENNLRVIEDSAQAAFVSVAGKPVGSFGDIGCFSTYVAHLLVTGVGGMSLTDDVELATIMRSLCNHGRDTVYTSIDDDKVADADQLEDVVSRRFRFDRVGYSYRITEMEAALGVAGLEDRDNVLATRQRNAEMFTRLLSPMAAQGQVSTPYVPAGTEHAYMVYPIVLSDEYRRADVIRYLEERGIETRPLYPLMTQPVYRADAPDLERQFPVAARLGRQGFFVGCHEGFRSSQIEYISSALKSCLGRNWR